MALTLEQQDAVGERWRNGEPVRVIARAVCCNREAVRRLLAVTGWIRPAARSRAPLRLALTEREEISRGLAPGAPLDAEDASTVGARHASLEESASYRSRAGPAAEHGLYP